MGMQIKQVFNKFQQKNKMSIFLLQKAFKGLKIDLNSNEVLNLVDFFNKNKIKLEEFEFLVEFHFLIKKIKKDFFFYFKSKEIKKNLVKFSEFREFLIEFGVEEDKIRMVGKCYEEGEYINWSRFIDI